MYGYWFFPVNYEAYEKEAASIDEQLAQYFVEAEIDPDGDICTAEDVAELEPDERLIESAALVRLDKEHFLVDDEEIGEYHLAIIGHSQFDVLKLENILYRLFPDYAECMPLMERYDKEKEAGLETTLSSDEMFQLLSLRNRYIDFNCFDNDIENVDDLEDFLRGEESAYASVIKKYV